MQFTVRRLLLSIAVIGLGCAIGLPVMFPENTGEPTMSIGATELLRGLAGIAFIGGGAGYILGRPFVGILAAWALYVMVCH